MRQFTEWVTRRSFAGFIALGMSLATADVSSGEVPARIYWGIAAGQFRGLHRATPPCFAPLETLAVMPPDVLVTEIALDLVNERLYWIEHTGVAVDGMIRRANLDGSPTVDPQIVVPNIPNTYVLGMDASSGKICWADNGGSGGNTGSVACSNLDGSGVTTIITQADTQIDTPGGVEIHDDKAYWSDQDYEWIKRADINRVSGQVDTSDIEMVVSGLCNPTGFAFDLVNDRIYVANPFTGTCSPPRIQRVQFVTSDFVSDNLQVGQSYDLILSDPGFPFNPQDIVVDEPNARIYWTSENGTILRAALDGSSSEWVLGTDPAPDDKPWGIALSGPIDLGPCQACGDGTVGAGEMCDDGNTDSGDGCSATCTCEGVCGDGIANPVQTCGECCDLGAANGQLGSGCTSSCGCEGSCTVAGTECATEGDCPVGQGCCGNATQEADEQCDAGPDVIGDCCTSSCDLVAADTVCRIPAGECDAAETCTGASQDCPVDVFEPAGIACTDDGDLCSYDACNGVLLTCQHPMITGCETITQTAGSGDTVTTDSEGDGATAADRVETWVTTPNPGIISIVELPISSLPPRGFTFVGQQVRIAAPSATAANPLVLQFEFDASLVFHQDPARMAVFRNGSEVPNCTSDPEGAEPDPCVFARVLQGDRDIRLTVRTSAASEWNFGIACYAPQKSFLKIRDHVADDDKDLLLWKWLRGAAIDPAELADPINTAAYTLRLYDGTFNLLREIEVPPHPMKWTSISDKGYKYDDATGAAGGVEKIVLRGSVDGSSKALVKAKGSNLSDVPFSSLSLPVRAQLVNADTGACVEAVYEIEDVVQNGVGQFKAKVQ